MQTTQGPQGAVTTSTQITVSSTTNGTLLLAANTRRIRATIRNLSTSTALYTGPTAAITATTAGMGLSPGSGSTFGDSYTTTDRVDAIYGVVASGSATVAVEEVSRV